MTRKQTESFQQDRLGNVNRELDDIRSQDGMVLDDGLVDIGDADVETDLVLMEVPEDAQGIYINEIHMHNGGGEEATANLLELELDDQGGITSSSIRSVPYNVAGGATRTVPFSGREFTGDAIGVVSGFTGSIGIGAYVDRKEEYEPSSELEVTPGE